MHLCELTGEDRKRMSDVVKKYEKMFVHKDNMRLGKIKDIEFHMDTGDHAPIKEKPRRVYGEGKLDDMYKTLKNMEDLEVIVRVHLSEWAAPVVMVRKSDGKWRFCVDYRKHNEITKTDPYPTPRMDDLINCMATSHYKTSIDLSSGFWQIPVAEDSKEKTVIPFVR